MTKAVVVEQALSLDLLHGSLRQHNVRIPRAKVLADHAEIADDMLARPELQRAFVEWILEQCGAPIRLRHEVYIRWEQARRPLLETFAPYAHHCTRVLLLLLVGETHKRMPGCGRATNRIDAEYLLYTPFCHVFVSSDKVHKFLAPLVMRDGQRFVTTDDFRHELRPPVPRDVSEPSEPA